MLVTTRIVTKCTQRLVDKRTTSHIQACYQRGFQSTADFETWNRQVRESSLPTPLTLEELPLSAGAPLLESVFPMSDHLKLAACSDATPGSPRNSLLQCTYPLASDPALRNTISDFSNWSSFRLGKFYEAVDALTGDVAYRHGALDGEPVTFVTAGHYNSRKLQRTNIEEDVMLRSYVTSVGTSSMEIRTDGLQRRANTDDFVLLNFCHTIMVALDPNSGNKKSLGKVGRQIAPLVLESDDDVLRNELAEQHAEIRRHRASQAMQLRSPISLPPTHDELTALHQKHQNRALLRESSSPQARTLSKISDYTFRSSTVVFPEQRNVHGKLFGGFVMEEAEKLAQYTAAFFAKGKPIIPLGIDEAIFLQPISIGDMITFTARLVHATAHTCRVLVVVEVRNPARREEVPKRSNRLLWVYGGSNFPPEGILPETYSEILMYTDAQRRYHVEGPTENDVGRILEESKE